MSAFPVDELERLHGSGLNLTQFKRKSLDDIREGLKGPLAVPVEPTATPREKRGLLSPDSWGIEFGRKDGTLWPFQCRPSVSTT